MRVEEARLISDNANKLKETLKGELSKTYGEIKENALSGLHAAHIHRGYLDKRDYSSRYLEQSIIESLETNGYSVTKQYSNPNNKWLLVSWLK